MQDLQPLCNENLGCFLKGNVEHSAKELCKLEFFYFIKATEMKYFFLSKRVNSRRKYAYNEIFFSKWNYERQGRKFKIIHSYTLILYQKRKRERERRRKITNIQLSTR
jgi:hypothetical protein